MAPRRTTKQSNRKQDTEPVSVVAKARANGNSAATNGVTHNGAKPTFEQVQIRAYELFMARGAAHGQDLADWFCAEQELSGTPASTH